MDDFRKSPEVLTRWRQNQINKAGADKSNVDAVVKTIRALRNAAGFAKMSGNQKINFRENEKKGGQITMTGGYDSDSDMSDSDYSVY